MTTLSVPDMHCPHCVSRITKALTEAGLKFEVSLENKTVTVDGCESCAEKARDKLSDLGFDTKLR